MGPRARVAPQFASSWKTGLCFQVFGVLGVGTVSLRDWKKILLKCWRWGCWWCVSGCEEAEIMDAGELLDVLSDEVRELSLGCTGEVARIEGPLDPLRFLREFVLPNRPCIITNAIDHWPALRLWSNSYLCAQLADHSVSCHFTPDGRADALVEATVDSGLGFDYGDGGREGGEIAKAGTASGIVFASALVEVLPFPEALNHVLRSSCAGAVAYLQHQNNCFPLEFSALLEDAKGDIGWASQALGCKPEAVNLWIGTQDSVTSFHKDHYENLYAVVSGEKHFTLMPPTDVHRMYVKKYPIAHYERTDSGSLVLKHDSPTAWVPWVSVDPYPKDSDLQRAKSQYSRYFGGAPAFECTVRAGELLYLPSMWFHHVRQTPDTEGRTIALNYWYDMQFDMKYAYFNLVESLTASSSATEKIPTYSDS